MAELLHHQLSNKNETTPITFSRQGMQKSMFGRLIGMECGKANHREEDRVVVLGFVQE